jgi:xylulokinase
MRLAVGLDVGTTGARAVAVDERGGVVASHTSEYPLLTPRPQWTEQDPAEWWRASREVLGRVSSASGDAGHEIAGIGLTG